MKYGYSLALGALATFTLAATGAQATVYTSGNLNGAAQGGSQDPGQQTHTTGYGQYFTSTGGTLNSLSFIDSDITNSGTDLIVQAFDTTTMTALGPILFQGTGAVSSYGDHTFADGAGGYVSYYYNHNFSNIGVTLAPGLTYVAYFADAPGTDTFNGTTSYGNTYDDDGNLITDPPAQCDRFGNCDYGTPVGTVGNGAYAFGLATSDSAIGGAFVFRNSDFSSTGGFTRIANATPNQSAYFQAAYTIGITPLAGAVPEPATWAMMIGGFGLVGASMRRRQRTTVVFA